MIRRRRIRADRHGRFRLVLTEPERSLLSRLPTQAAALLADGDPSTTRVFPVAYPADSAAEADFRRLMGSELLAAQQEALATMAATADRRTLDAEELDRWLSALEVLRLVLGTQLDVTEDHALVDADDPQAPAFALYHYLSALQDDAVEALSATLGEPTGD